MGSEMFPAALDMLVNIQAGLVKGSCLQRLLVLDKATQPLASVAKPMTRLSSQKKQNH